MVSELAVVSMLVDTFQVQPVTSVLMEVTVLGSTLFSLLLYTVYMWYGRQYNDTDTVMFGRAGVYGVLVVSGIVAGIKFTVQRTIPDHLVYADILYVPYVFPSGHTAVAVFTATMLANRYQKLAPVFYTIALGVGITRMMLGVHYPSDVVVGGLIGYVAGYILRR